MSKILIDEAVVRQALEVLEKYSGVDQRACDVEEAINQAIADAALDKMADNARELGLSYEQPDHIEDVLAMVEQPAPEPVAWMQEMPTQEGETRSVRMTTLKDHATLEWDNPVPLYAAPPAPEPDELTIAYMSGVYEGKKRKPWVGLTDEERNNLWRDVVGWGDPSHDDEDLMKAIEAKLMEKNT